MPLAIGQVFYYSYSAGWDKPSHPKIVVTLEEGIVVFVHATTNQVFVERHCRRVEKKKTHLLTKVFLKAGCCIELPKDCWVNCNAASYEEELIMRTEPTFKETTSFIPIDSIRKIRVGILSSDLISDKIRKMIRATIGA